MKWELNKTGSFKCCMSVHWIAKISWTPSKCTVLTGRVSTVWQCTCNIILRRVRYHCFRGKAINTTYLCMCVCVFGRVGVLIHVRACSLAYPACNSYTPYCKVICGFSGPPYFSILSHQRHDFRKKFLTSNMCFYFLYNLCLKHIPL